MNYEVITADCLDHMRTMADNAVDAVVTDPPYGLSDRSEDPGPIPSAHRLDIRWRGKQKGRGA